MAKAPNSYKDPYWSKIAADAEAKVGIPDRLLRGILLQGEKSNNDQVSSAGARTPFQIIPATRKLILDKYGIDPYLSPENAAEGAALLLKESLDRNKGDIEAAVGEYHGGPDRKNWGPINAAYRKRVVGDLITPTSPVDTEAINADIKSWLTNNQTSLGDSKSQVDQVKDIQTKYNQNIQEAGASNKTEEPATEDTAADPARTAINTDLQAWLANQKAPAQPEPDLGFFGGIKEAITGQQRATPQTQSLPEWVTMPELNTFSMASAKTGLGTMFSAPDEIVQVIKANYPDTQVSQDSKGNYLLKSSIDGKDYVIPPGITVGDIPRVVGGLAAFTPAGRATSALGLTGAKGLAAQAATSGAAAAATQAAIEGTQAATGGNFSGSDVALTGLLGGVLPPVMKGVEAVGGLVASPIKGALNRVMGRAGQEAAPTQSIAPAVAPVAEGVPSANMVAKSVPAEMPLRDMAQTAVKAGEGGIGSKKAAQTMAEMAAPDPKTIEAAKRLDIVPYLQSDHVTTSQVYKEIVQAAKSSIGSETRTAEMKGLEQVAKRADDLITQLGGTDDLASVSQNIKNGLQKTHDILKGDAKKIYNEIDNKLVQTAAEAPAPNTLAFVAARAKTLGGKEYLTAGEKGILKKLSPKGEKQPTYALLDQIRKEIGAAKRGAQNAFGNADSKLLGDLESALRSDQGAVATANGLGQKWEAAQGLARTYKGLENDLTALFGKTLEGSIVGDLSGAVNVLAKGDTSKFFKLIKSVPEDMRQELVASGLATAFGKSAKQQTISFNSYAKWYEGLLKNKQAHAALMSNLPPSARKSLSDLYRVSNGIATASKERITTGRLQTAEAAFKGGETLAAKIYDAAKHHYVAAGAGAAASVINPGLGVVVASVLSKGAKTPAIQAADKLFASPQFQQAVNQAAKGQAKPAAEKLAKSKVFSDFVFKIGNPGEMSNRERWILQALEAGSSNNQQQATSR